MLESYFNFVANTTELTHDELLGTDCVRRIVESDMNTMFNITDKRRATLVCTPAYSYHIIPRLVKIFSYIVRDMTAYIDAFLQHDFDGKRIDPFRRFRASGKYIQNRIKRLEKTVSHLTAATVTGA